MKTHVHFYLKKTNLLLLFSLLFSVHISAQQYCNYDEEIAIDFGGGADEPYVILQQEDGKILVIGTSYFSGTNSFQSSVLRLNHNNTIDTTFGNNGRVGHTWDSRNTCISAALQSDGKILIGGYQAPGNGSSTFRAYVARLLEDGSVDTSFGIAGSALLDFQSSTKSGSVGINQLENGKIQVAIFGSNPSGGGILQLDEFGVYDSTYSDDGRAYYESNYYWQTDYGNGLFLSDGSVILVSKTYNTFTKPQLTKINADGSLDSNFAIDGLLVIERAIQYNFAGIYAVLNSDEDIIIAATTEGVPKKYLLFKVNGETGELDSSFGVDGIVESSDAGSFGAVQCLAVDPNNDDFFIMGSGGNLGYDATMWRVDAQGIEIPSCEGTSFKTYDFYFDQGFRAAMVTESGTLRTALKGSAVDSLVGTSGQGQNFVIPNNILWAGVKEVKSFQFDVYPNPFTNELNIDIDPTVEVDQIRIINQMGQSLISIDKFQSRINLSQLTKGLYFIEIVSANQRVIKKLIKQ
jgi:uncharacterized delta-60 repeat protein